MQWNGDFSWYTGEAAVTQAFTVHNVPGVTNLTNNGSKQRVSDVEILEKRKSIY